MTETKRKAKDRKFASVFLCMCYEGRGGWGLVELAWLGRPDAHRKPSQAKTRQNKYARKAMEFRRYR